MIQIIVATHGGFANGIMSTLSMIAGDAEGVTPLSVEPGESPDSFYDIIMEKIDELSAQPDCDGILILVDLLGGTPSNTSARVLGAKGVDNIRCIAGLNFPMLVEAVFSRDSMTLPELEASCMEAARNGVVSLAEMFNLGGNKEE